MNHLKKQIIDAIVNKVDKRFRIIRDWSFKFPQKNSLKPNLKKMIYVDGSVTRSGFVVKYVIIFKFFFDSSLLLWNKKWKNWHCRVLGRRCRKLFRDLFLILVGFVINPPPTRLKFQLHLHQHWITQEIPSHTHSIDPTHFYFPLTSFDKKKYFDEKKNFFQCSVIAIWAFSNDEENLKIEPIHFLVFLAKILRTHLYFWIFIKCVCVCLFFKYCATTILESCKIVCWICSNLYLSVCCVISRLTGIWSDEFANCWRFHPDLFILQSIRNDF